MKPFNYHDFLDKPNELVVEIQKKFGSTKEEASNQIFGTLTFLVVNGKPAINKEKCYEVLTKLGFKKNKIKDALDNFLAWKHLNRIPYAGK